MAIEDKKPRTKGSSRGDDGEHSLWGSSVKSSRPAARASDADTFPEIIGYEEWSSFLITTS